MRDYYIIVLTHENGAVCYVGEDDTLTEEKYLCRRWDSRDEAAAHLRPKGGWFQRHLFRPNVELYYN